MSFNLPNQEVPRDWITLVIAAACLDKDLYAQLQTKLRREYIPMNAMVEEQTWRLLQDFHARYGTLPSPEILKAELSRYAASAELDQESVNDFLDVYDGLRENYDETAKNYVWYAAEQWLLMSGVIQPLKQANLEPGQADLHSVITDCYEKSSQLRLEKLRTSSLADYLMSSEGISELIPTGVTFIDERIGGGFLGGEVALLLGPTKGGKTTIGLQIAADSAMRTLTSSDKRLTAFIGYEDDGHTVAMRVLSYLARIPRDRLLRQGRRILENQDSVTPEDFEVMVSEGRTVTTEGARLQAALQVSESLKLVDFSGRSTGATSVGCGGVDEIVQALKLNDPDQRGYKLIIIDWAGIMATRYLMARNSRDTQRDLALYLRSLPDELHRKVAAPYGAAVILIHQLAGAANKHSPVSDVGFTEAENCKSMAFLAWFSMVLRKPDPVTRVSLFDVEVARRCEKTEPAIVKLHGEYGYFEDVSRYYIVDRTTKRILQRDEYLDGLRQAADRRDDRFNL